MRNGETGREETQRHEEIIGRQRKKDKERRQRGETKKWKKNKTEGDREKTQPRVAGTRPGLERGPRSLGSVRPILGDRILALTPS